MRRDLHWLLIVMLQGPRMTCSTLSAGHRNLWRVFARATAACFLHCLTIALLVMCWRVRRPRLPNRHVRKRLSTTGGGSLERIRQQE